MLSSYTTLLLGPPVDFLASAKKYIMGRTPRTVYLGNDVDSILFIYREACAASGVDLEFAVTQMIHETGALTSDWSQIPKRNPAGIGVTGVAGEGQVFDTWADAIQCHIGLILCYRFATGATVTSAQQRLITQCLSFRPGAPRGVGSTLGELAVKWATDTTYVDKLVSLAVNIAKT